YIVMRTDGLGYVLEGNENNNSGQFDSELDSDEIVVTDMPGVSITSVTPNPRGTPVSSVNIVFSKPVTGFDLADLRLTRNGGPDLLTDAQTLTSSDGVTWTLGNLDGLTAPDGTYNLRLNA